MKQGIGTYSSSVVHESECEKMAGRSNSHVWEKHLRVMRAHGRSETSLKSCSCRQEARRSPSLFRLLASHRHMREEIMRRS